MLFLRTERPAIALVVSTVFTYLFATVSANSARHGVRADLAFDGFPFQEEPVAAELSGGWPDAAMGQRTSERVSAGRRAARHIACDVCEERVLQLLPTKRPDADVIWRLFEAGAFQERLADVKNFCKMRDLADLFRSRRLEVATKADGTAELRKTSGDVPFYEDINTSDFIFHWKSLAVQHACSETFRRDGVAVARRIERALVGAEGGIVGESMLSLEEPNPGELSERMHVAVRQGCRASRFCKAAVKLKEEATRAEL